MSERTNPSLRLDVRRSEVDGLMEKASWKQREAKTETFTPGKRECEFSSGNTVSRNAKGGQGLGDRRRPSLTQKAGFGRKSPKENYTETKRGKASRWTTV